MDLTHNWQGRSLKLEICDDYKNVFRWTAHLYKMYFARRDKIKFLYVCLNLKAAN